MVCQYIVPYLMVAELGGRKSCEEGVNGHIFAEGVILAQWWLHKAHCNATLLGNREILTLCSVTVNRLP